MSSDQSYQDLLNKASQLGSFAFSSRTDLKYDWSDEHFKQQYRAHIFNPPVTDTATLLKIWFQWMYEPKSKVQNFPTVLFHAISSFPELQGQRTNEEIRQSLTEWPKLVDLGKALERLSQPKGESSSNPEFSDPQDFSGLMNLDSDQSGNSQPSTEFLEMLTDLDNKDNHSVLLSIMGFQALVLLRAMVKSKTSIHNYFLNRFTMTLKNLCPNVQINETIKAPCERIIEVAILNLQKGSETSKSLFIPVLNRYMDAIEKGESTVKSILDAGCMIHTKGNGMGLMILTMAAATSWGMDAAQYLSYMCTETTMKSLDRLITTFNKYGTLKSDKKTPEITWWWARIIDDGYFTELTIAQNMTLCLRNAYILLPQNEDILSAAAFKDASAELKKSAQQFVDKITNYRVNVKKETMYGMAREAMEYEKEKKPKESSKYKL